MIAEIKPMIENQPQPEQLRERTVWEKPEFHRIGADEAETGINNGPEILILLS